MLSRTERDRRAMQLWTARIVPIVLALIVAYATYVLVALLCINYLLVKHKDRSAAIGILIVYFCLLFFMSASFLRLVYITTFDPPYLPLGSAAIRNQDSLKSKSRSKMKRKAKDVEHGAYLGGPEYMTEDPQNDPDSPGLEKFYTKEVFTCEGDGKPRWCSECSNWKPDRTHHCSDVGRCIYKMDHFCPWVGGPVGESTLKFFIQFNTYATAYCVLLLVVMAFYVHKQRETVDESLNNNFAAILGLAAFFGTFTASMSGQSINLALKNLTLIENLNAPTKVHSLAVLVPPREERVRVSAQAASEIVFSEITYPLSIQSAPDSEVTDAGDSGVVQTQAKSTNSYRQHIRQSQPIPINQQSPPTENSSARESPSDRDLRATKTFAVLKTEPGDNPWHLGSYILNWQTVMGMTVFDWLLPIRRSPCCNHDDPESYYALGPVIDILRARFYFVSIEDVRLRSPSRRRKRHSPRARDVRKDRSRRPHGETEMRDLNSHLSRIQAE